MTDQPEQQAFFLNVRDGDIDILAHRGSIALEAIRCCGRDFLEHDINLEGAPLPHLGFYVWEGIITEPEDGLDEDGFDFEWKYEGAFRPADELDPQRFGMEPLAPVTLGQRLEFQREKEAK